MSDENKSDSKVTKDEKHALNTKLYSPTIRLTIPLDEPDEESCPVFNYISLIAKEKRKRRCEKEKIAINGSTEENPEADEDVKRIAKYFEEKYSKKSKALSLFDFPTLAAGYDESDSFIDNSDVNNDLPADKETMLGGYYVNCGQLKLKRVELEDDTSDFEENRTHKRKNGVLSSDESDDDDEDSVKSNTEEVNSAPDDVETTKSKLPEETDKGAEPVKSILKASKPSGGDKLEKAKENVSNNLPKMNGELEKKIKKSKKRPHDVMAKDNDAANKSSKPVKKIITVKTLLDEKRVAENGDACALPGKHKDIARNSVNDIIESVVNAARNHSDDSRDSTCSSSDTKSIDSKTSYDTEKDSHHEEMEVIEASSACGLPSMSKEQIKLPDNLPADVLELISQIKDTAQNGGFGGIKTLNPYINSKLLSLEMKVRPLMPNARQALYGHLANFLPCSKETLMKRARNLLIDEEEKRMKEPLKKLKANIDKIMPTLLNNYNIACQQAEEKNNELSKNGDLDDKKTSAVKHPHKKFVWTEETRSCLRDLVACRLNCFHLLKPRKESQEDYVKKFLETKVKPLWPDGWMDAAILWKESKSPSPTTSKVKKSSSSSSTSSGPKTKHSSVPSSNNSTTSAISAANYSLLHSLAMYSQSDMGYPLTTTSSIPFRPDLSILTPGMVPMQNASLPLSMDLLSSFTLANYGKATSPPKKQSPSPGFSSQRSTTPHSLEKKSDKGDGSKSKHEMKKVSEAKKCEKASNEAFITKHEMFKKDAKHEANKSSEKINAFLSQYKEILNIDAAKKSDKKSNEALQLKELMKIDPKYNEMLKMDSILNAQKNKKEHHMLNHISQYNKHYSHKTEKRKSTGHERKEKPTQNNVTSTPTAAKTSPCEVLDLSPSKTSKSDAKPESISHRRTPESHSKNEINHKSETIYQTPESQSKNDANLGISISATTSKDHTYWSNPTVSDVLEVKEQAKHDKTPVLPLISRSISTPETTITPVAQAVTPKPTHISRKQRILQESAKSAAQEVMKTPESTKPGSQDSSKSAAQPFQESTYSNESHTHSIAKHLKEDDKLPSIKEEKKPVEEKMIEETATATDILSKIINDTLQDNSTPLQPQFTNPLFENSRIKQEVKMEDVELQLNEYIDKSHPPSRESHTPLLDKSSPCSVNSERKTPSTDRAEIEAAEVINDLLVLNQIGGHNPMRRTDYQDSRYIDNRHLNSDMNFNNGSMLSQSSPHNSSCNKTSSIPRMSLTGFQDEFLQHIFKMDRDNSSYSNSTSKQENCFSPDFPVLENNKSSFNHISSSSSVKPGNTSLFNYQSVIMPPSSIKWHIPESKS